MRAPLNMNSNAVLRLGAIVFVVLGMNTSVLGPGLQTLALNTGASIAELGTLFTTLSIGYLLAAPVIALISRSPALRIMHAGPLLLALGFVALIAARTLLAVLISAFMIGLGQACTQVAVTTQISHVLRGDAQADARLSRVNAFYGIGALISPVIASASYAWFDSVIPAFFLQLLMSTMAFVLLLRLPLGQKDRPARQQAIAGRVSWTPLLVLILGMGLYVGVEVSFAGWSTEFARRAAAVDISQAAFTTSIFFTGLAVSRFFASIALARVPILRLVFVLIALAATGHAVMLLPGVNLPLQLAGAFLVGMGYGPIFPAMLAIGIARYPDRAQLVASVITSSGSLGSITVPALTGAVMSASGTTVAWQLQLTLLAALAVLWLAGQRVLRSDMPSV
jgi:FHS family Na+ dependent glucose MFS transporter 1